MTAAARTHPKTRSSGWSPERRAKHAASIKIWAPWAKSTGPRTATGKARSAMNAYKHGGRRAAMRFFAAALTRQRLYVRTFNTLARLKRHAPANELLDLCEFRLRWEGENIKTTLHFLLMRVLDPDGRSYCSVHDG